MSVQEVKIHDYDTEGTPYPKSISLTKEHIQYHGYFLVLKDMDGHEFRVAYQDVKHAWIALNDGKE